MSSELTFDKMKRLIPIVIALVVLLPLCFMHSCANTTQAPTGGKKDTIPPYIIDIKPLPGAVNVPRQGAKFIFTFNEYVTIKQARNIFLSPPQQKPVKARLSGKDLIVSFEEPLDSNTTYTLSFTGALADNNEGNMFAGYTYAFSTGQSIDSLMITGTVLDCQSLAPKKDVTVLLYKDLRDSAVLLQRPFAATKTDDWGYFVIPFIGDTDYRLYAIKDENNNNMYDPETELIAFADSLIRPVMKAVDTIPEMLKYDMLDTLMCLARKSEHELLMFREKPTKQYIVKQERTADRSAYVTFQSPNAWIDSVWVKGYRGSEVITQFNIMQDSLEIWVNNRKPAPDTLHVFVDYRKTDTLGRLRPNTEHLKLTMPKGKKVFAKMSRKDIKKEDTTCVYKLEATPETVEQNGFSLEFKYPIIYENFDSLHFRSVSPRQKEETAAFEVEQDTLNIRHYTIRPKGKLLPGYEYFLKLPYRAFRDINGFYSDSTELKITLPKDETLSTICAHMVGVDRKIIVDLLDEKRQNTLRTYVTDKDEDLIFPYLKPGKYSIRITDDGNRNSIVDTGSLLEHRQPEKVRFYELNGDSYIDIPASTELDQTIDIQTLFR